MTPLTAALANLSRKRFITYKQRQRLNPLNCHFKAVHALFVLFGVFVCFWESNAILRGINWTVMIRVLRRPSTWRSLSPSSVPAVWNGGVQLSEVGVGRGRQSGPAVSHGHFYERLHDVRHPRKRHFRALRVEPHFAVRQHRLHRAEIHRQTHSTLYLQGRKVFIFILCLPVFPCWKYICIFLIRTLIYFQM